MNGWPELGPDDDHFPLTPAEYHRWKPDAGHRGDPGTPPAADLPVRNIDELFDRLTDDYTAMQEALEDAERRLADTTTALKRYGDHDRNCSVDIRACNCGWSAALAGLATPPPESS